MRKINKTLLIVVIFVTMVIIAMSENGKGVLVPTFKTVFRINDGSIGFLLLLVSFSYMLGTYMASHLINLITRKKTWLLGALLLGAGNVILMFTNGLFLFYISFVFSNIGMSLMAFCVNTLIPKLKVKHTAVIMNLVHFSYGVGAMVTHKGTGLLLKNNFTYKKIYMVLFGMVIILLAITALAKFSPEKVEIKKIDTKLTSSDKKLIALLSLALGLYISTEVQTGNWLVDYIKSSFSYSENKASNYTSLFFLFFTSGRLFGGVVSQKIGYLKSVIYSLSIAFTTYTLGLIFLEKGLLLLSISGIFFSIAFPIIVLSINDYFSKNLNRVSGIIMTVASAINMLMGFVIGQVAKTIGINLTMYLVPVMLFLTIVLLIYIKRNGKKLAKQN